MSEPKKMTITIEVEGGKEEATISCNGEVYVVRGLGLFADGGTEGQLFSFFWNSPELAAKAVVRSCATAFQRGDETAKSFYSCLLRLFASATSVQPDDSSGLKKLEDWEREDIELARFLEKKLFH